MTARIFRPQTHRTNLYVSLRNLFLLQHTCGKLLCSLAETCIQMRHICIRFSTISPFSVSPSERFFTPSVYAEITTYYLTARNTTGLAVVSSFWASPLFANPQHHFTALNGSSLAYLIIDQHFTSFYFDSDFLSLVTNL